MKPPMPAPVLRTITDADWREALRFARNEGRREGSEILGRIRAAVRLQELKASKLEPTIKKKFTSHDA